MSDELLERTGLPILLVDASLAVRRFTRAATAVFDLEGGDEGRALQDLRPRVLDDALVDDVRAVLAGRAVPDREVSAEDGRTWLRRVLATEDDDGPAGAAVLTWTDLSAVRGGERLARERLAHLETIYRHSGIGLAELDHELRYRHVNETLAAINGLPIEAHLGRTLVEALGSAAAREAEGIAAGVLARGDPAAFAEVRTATGSTDGVPRDWEVGYHAVRGAPDGRATGVTLVVRDITVRRTSERIAALERDIALALTANVPLETALEGVLDRLGTAYGALAGTLLLDGERRAVTALPYTGLSAHDEHEADSLLRRLARNLDDAPVLWARHLDHDPEHGAAASRLGVLSAFGLAVLDGDHHHGPLVLLFDERLGDDADSRAMLERIGRVLGAYVRRRSDELAIRRRERELEQARAAAELASQAKSEFLANVSHELRSPLTAILGHADLLQLRLENAENRRSAHTVRENGDHLLALLDDILDLNRIESGKFEHAPDEVGLTDLLGGVHELMDVRAREQGLAFDVRLDGPLPERIVVDGRRVRQILINLVGNAVKFTDVGGVTLAVREETDGEPRLRIDVTDTGIGMTRAQRERLFEPFTQLDGSSTRRHPGTGLGLAISRRLARQLGGDLTVTSAPGAGSTFALHLPFAMHPDAPAPRSLSMPHVSPPPTTAPTPASERLDARVLVADDRPDIRALVQRMLEYAGADVIAVGDGEAVLEVLDPAATDSAPPDALVLDMQMPRLDGYEVTRRLREAGFARPIVALTASAMRGERERCLEVGCDAYLSKPIDIDRLVGTLSALLERTVPADDEDPEPVEPVSRRVMVVDDSEGVRLTTSEMLTHAGHEVRSFANGVAALAAAADWRPDVALIDLGLPDVDGHEVARRLRAAAGDAPRLIAFSGRPPVDADGASPFDDHLLKPARLDTLDELVRGTGPGDAL